MLRMVALGACFLVTLAGCSSAPGPEGPTTSSSSAVPSSATVLTFTKPVLTDTLHLLDAPHFAATLNARSAPIRTPVATAGAQDDGAALWRMPRPEGLDVLQGNATVWVEVKGAVASATAGECFWVVYLRVESADGFSAQGQCLPEPAVVPEGIRALSVSFAGFDISDTAGDVVALWVTAASGVLAPGASIEVLSGTLGQDSQVTLSGLQVPLDTQTLLV